MKLFKKIVTLNFIILTLLVMPVLITNSKITSSVQAASIKINKTNKKLKIGDKFKLKITGTTKKVKWTSSNKKIATVNLNGKVTAKKTGNVTIKAKVDGKKFKCKIKVVDKPTINTKKKTLKVGKKYILKITGTNKKVKWTSSNKKVATVNSNGKVTAKKKGTAIITAKVGNKKITCKITVKNDDVLKVGSHTLKYGKYNWHYSYGVQGEDMTYTINKDGTFSYIRKWNNYEGVTYTDTGSGKYKIYYSKGDDYDPTSCWVMKCELDKYHSTYEPANSYPMDYYIYDVTKDDQFQERQGIASFTYKGN